MCWRSVFTPEHLPNLEAALAAWGWTIHPVATLAAARDWLAHHSAPVILSETEFPDGGWKDVLRVTRRVAPPSNPVVASALADDRLWAEVLNSGGYDVIALPCSRAELFRILDGASMLERQGRNGGATG